MGFNTVALFLNDQADDIREHPDQLCESLWRCMASGRGSKDRRDLYLLGQTTVLPSQHADTLQIIVAGGNTIKVLGYAHWIKFNNDEEILRALADQHGFRLVHKRKPA